MSKKISTIFILMIIVNHLFAQNNLITLSTETNSVDGVVSLNALSTATGTYTLKIKLNVTGYLNNYSNPYYKTITQGSSLICKFTPDKSASMSGIGYNYTYFAGTAFRKAPANYLHYILPISETKTTTAIPVNKLSSVLKQTTDNQFEGQGFTFEKGDTIYASRAGLVYNINDQIKIGESKDKSYSAERNKILIQHRDGTLAQYTTLAPIKSLVEVGDNVIPGQPIAFFDATAEKYIMLLSVYYLDEKKINIDSPREIYNPLPIYFYLNENNLSTTLVDGQKYDAIRSSVIIAEELSKKEKKKFGFSN